MEVGSSLSKELKVLIESAHNKLKELIDTIKSQITEKKDDIIKHLESDEVNYAIMRSSGLLLQEQFIKNYELLNNYIETLEKNCKQISSSNECPSELRIPLDSFIYVTKKTNVDNFIKYKEKIQEIYGEQYIDKAEKNEDNFVDVVLVENLKKKGFTLDEMKLRVKQLCKERNLEFDFR